MAKIGTYPIITTAALNDIVIGTDVSDKNNTKNFLISQILSLGGGGGGVLLQTDGVDNVIQNKLNLIGGDNITLTDDGLGGVVIDADGGNQNLDQVLAVGSVATNKNITLNNGGLNAFYVSGGIGNNNAQYSLDISLITEAIFNLEIGANTFPFNNSRLYSSIKNSGISFFSLERTISQPIGPINKKFIVENDTGVNSVNLSYVSSNVGATIASDIELFAEGQISRITLRSSFNTSVGYETSVLKHNSITFTNTSGYGQEISPSFPSSGTILNNFPEFDGKIANVNERIIKTDIDLKAGDYNADGYGVYVIVSGSGDNFVLDDFINNGVDGQFLTVCVEETNVNLVNGLGLIIGPSVLTSTGLYKIMKIGTKAYVSNV